VQRTVRQLRSLAEAEVSPSDRIVSVDQVSNNQVLIVYQRGAVVTAALFSTQDGAKIKESPLPINK